MLYQLLSRLRALLNPDHADQINHRTACLYWRRDPLSHPAIRKMSLRERADLPIDPNQIEDE